MKITKAQLKNIIAEELEALGEPPVDQAAEEIEKLAVRALRTVYSDLKKSYALEDDPSTALKVVEAMLKRTRSKSSLEELNAMDNSDETINEMEAEVVAGLTPENIQIVLLGLKKLALETGLPLAALTAAAMKIHQRIDPKSSKDES